MSFYYLKNINFKKQALKVASNNVRPLIYYEVAYKELLQDDFIKEVLYNIFMGGFRIHNKKYSYLNTLINNLKLDYDYKKEEENKNALLNAFKNYKVIKGNFALKINNYCYLKKLTKNNLKYTFNSNDFKIYKTLEEATTDQNYIKNILFFKLWGYKIMILKNFNIFLGDTNIKELFTPKQIENLLKLPIKDFKALGFKLKRK